MVFADCMEGSVSSTRILTRTMSSPLTYSCNVSKLSDDREETRRIGIMLPLPGVIEALPGVRDALPGEGKAERRDASGAGEASGGAGSGESGGPEGLDVDRSLSEEYCSAHRKYTT